MIDQKAARVVHVVDDDQSFRTVVIRILAAAGLSARTHASPEELLAHLSGEAATRGPGCVLADLHMPEPAGLHLQRMCATAGASLPFVFLTGRGDVSRAVAAMRQGAVTVLEKYGPLDELVPSLEEALERDVRFRAWHARRKELDRRFARLSDREREVLDHLVEGKKKAEIAAELGIHERTVTYHRHNVGAKLEVRSLAELAALATEFLSNREAS